MPETITDLTYDFVHIAQEQLERIKQDYEHLKNNDWRAFYRMPRYEWQNRILDEVLSPLHILKEHLKQVYHFEQCYDGNTKPYEAALKITYAAIEDIECTKCYFEKDLLSTVSKYTRQQSWFTVGQRSANASSDSQDSDDELEESQSQEQPFKIDPNNNILTQYSNESPTQENQTKEALSRGSIRCRMQ